MFLANRSAYQEIICEDESGLEILEEIGYYRLYRQEKKYFLTNRNQAWTVEVPLGEAYYTLLKDNSLLYLYQNGGYWFVREYGSDGKLHREKQILANKFTLRAAVYHQALYLAGYISEYQDASLLALREEKQLQGKDGLLLRLDDNYDSEIIRVYGGMLDEIFLELTATADCLYLAGIKDPLTGGDFGNGGRTDDCFFVAKLDFALHLLQYQVLSVSGTALDLVFYEDFLYLATDKSLYKFSADLEIVRKKIFAENYYYGCLAAFNRFLLFSEEAIACVNIFNFTETEIAAPVLEEAVIKGFDRSLYLIKPEGRYYYDLACLENFIILNPYHPEVETDRTVVTIFGTAEFVEETTAPVFNPLLHGVYERVFQFRTPDNRPFSVVREQEVELRVNVCENMVYPLGYELQFTGQAFLNGQPVFNHYPLTKSGPQTLELYDLANQKTTINFEVSKEQIRFQEPSVRSWDLTVQAGQSFPLDFRFVTSGLDSAAVSINGEERDLAISEEHLTLELTAPDVPGIHYYYLRELRYSQADSHYTVPLHRVLIVNVLQAPPEFSVFQEKPLSFRISLTDPGRTSRYFELVLSNSNTESSRRFYFTDCNLYLEELDKEQIYQWSLYLIYDLGDGELRKAELFHGTAKGHSLLGELNILQKGEGLEVFRIGFRDAALKKVYAGEDLLYAEQDTPVLPKLFYGLGGSLLAGCCAYLIRRLLAKKKSQTLSA
jgi:hypothetical protein